MVCRTAVVLAALAGCRIGFDERRAPDATTVLPPRFVQTDSTMSPGTTTIALSFPAEVSAGDLILCAIDFAPGAAITLTAVSDDRGNTYSTAGPFDGDTDIRHYLAWSIAASGGSTTVTAQLSGAPAMYFDLRLHEYANVAASSPVHGAASAAGTTTALDAAQSPPVITTEPNELIFGFVTYLGPAGVPGTGFTQRSMFDADLTEDMVAPEPGSYRALSTSNGSSWTAIVAAIRGR